MVDHMTRRRNDLLGWPLVAALFKNRRVLFIVRTAAALLFVSAIGFGLRYPAVAENPYTTAVFWSLFWPFFMIVSIVLIGPGFCGVCPHGVIGRFFSKIGAQKEAPAWLKHRGIGLGILIAAYWVPVYLFPGALKTPWVAAALFAGLTLLALFVFSRYKDMAYCTYLCPIGSVTKSYGKLGAVRLQTYRDACDSCTTFDCAKACETGLQPYLFEKKNSMRDCTLCMDCAQACEAVSLQLVKPSKGMFGEVNDRHTIHTYVYILLLAIITITMHFHHGLGHSPVKTQTPWYAAGQWLASFLPAGVDWVGFAALVMALGVTGALVLGGYAVAAALANKPFKSFLHRNSYALAPMMIIGSLSHVGSFFFLEYASDLANAWYWLTGSTETMKPLASMRDGWVHLFSLFGYVGALWSAVILYSRLGMYEFSTAKRLAAFAASGATIWFYIGLLVLSVVVRSH
ncbi:4Fe-4S binding protein [Sulfurimonas diazotrophicus]|uniref:4Fe-4S binding protein n=1 Tax=Sulfurimonas diazotrophicus TaxID=3131939 RepID=A0ABZ3H9E7_9BACT